MKQLWSASIDDVLEAIKRAEANGKKKGESFEAEMLEIMKEKNKKPIGCTELSKEELIEEAMTKNDSILQINVDKTGKTEMKSYKKRNKKK